MILSRPSAKIIAHTVMALNLIEAAGRTCYKSEDKMTDESCIPFTEMIIKRDHLSVLEHASASVRFICDRGVSHEIVRHRLASFSQESTRYCDYNNGHVEFIIPPWVNGIPGAYQITWDKLIGTTDYNGISMSTPEDTGNAERWFWAMALAEREYRHLRTGGWRPEQARSVLPNSLKTELVMTANLREWLHFFTLRTAKAAHPQMREVAIPLLHQFQQIFPIIFDDVKPSA